MVIDLKAGQEMSAEEKKALGIEDDEDEEVSELKKLSLESTSKKEEEIPRKKW